MGGGAGKTGVFIPAPPPPVHNSSTGKGAPREGIPVSSGHSRMAGRGKERAGKGLGFRGTSEGKNGAYTLE